MQRERLFTVDILYGSRYILNYFWMQTGWGFWNRDLRRSHKIYWFTVYCCRWSFLLKCECYVSASGLECCFLSWKCSCHSGKSCSSWNDLEDWFSSDSCVPRMWLVGMTRRIWTMKPKRLREKQPRMTQQPVLLFCSDRLQIWRSSTSSLATGFYAWSWGESKTSTFFRLPLLVFWLGWGCKRYVADIVYKWYKCWWDSIAT